MGLKRDKDMSDVTGIDVTHLHIHNDVRSVSHLHK